MDKIPPKIEVGEDSVVIGKVIGRVGKRSVVVHHTDERHNTILDRQMAIGYGAKAGTNSLAIGAFASAGVCGDTRLVSELSMLHEVISQAPEAAEHQDSVAQIGHALEAAKRDDSQSVRAHLKAAGYWAYQVANEIGVQVAASLVLKALNG